jgi:hypothetical protein
MGVSMGGFMSIRLEIALVIYMMVQGFMFGVALIALLTSRFSTDAMQLMPWIVGATAVASAPISWMIAPRLRGLTEIRAEQRQPVTASIRRV